MASALIGHTGFVGGTLLRQRRFEALYNSKNIEQIAGRRFDLIVCAGAPAEKWKANQNPEADWQSLERLCDALRQADTKRLVLISTVDVYGKPFCVTEDDPPTDATPYGAHRHRLEQLLAERFPTLIVRLPGLYGAGLKKNAIYDLLHDNHVERIDSRGVFQFYGLDRLWSDIATADRAGLSLVHFATEPVSVHEIAQAAFDRDFRNEFAPRPAWYNLRSRHAALYGGSGGYMQTWRDVLAGIRQFVAQEQQVKKCA